METLETLSAAVLKELWAAGLKLNVKKHYSLLVAAAQLDKKLNEAQK